MISACERGTRVSLKAAAWSGMQAASSARPFNYSILNLVYTCQHDYAAAPEHLVAMTTFELFEFLIGH